MNFQLWPENVFMCRLVRPITPQEQWPMSMEYWQNGFWQAC